MSFINSLGISAGMGIDLKSLLVGALGTKILTPENNE